MTTRHLALSFILLAAGCASGISHTKLIDPTIIAKVEGLEKLGDITSIKAAPGALYVAGQDGVAAVNEQGKTLWTLELPPATMRLIDADAAGAAFSAFDLLNVDRAKGLKSFIMGNEGDMPEFNNQKLGAVSPDGKLLWSVDLGGKATSSRPGLSPDQVAVSRGQTLDAYSRSNGARAFSANLGASQLSFDSQILQASFNQPVFLNGAWYAAHLNHFTKTLPNGSVENDSIKDGLFSPFQNISSNLLPVGDGVAFGNSPWGDMKMRLFKSDAGAGIAWNGVINDKETGVGAVAANSSTIFAATNFRLVAFSLKGSEKWTKVNGKGGLYFGHARGVRFIGNAFAKQFAIRKSQSQQMAADEKNVYVTAKHGKGDAITVLNAETGEYVDSLDMKALVTELTMFGNSLAVATDDGLELIALQ